MTSTRIPPARVLTSIAERLTVTGMYSSPEDALTDMALTQIDQEIEDLRAQDAALQDKYRMSFDEFTASLCNKATMANEMAGEEWEDLRLKLSIRQKSKEAIQRYATGLG